MMDGGKARNATLDALFRANVARDPDGVALQDPPDREAITGNPPRSLTYAQADRRIGALARLLHEIGIPEGGTVAIQLPNSADSVIALLAVARAGMVPAMLPLLWRRAECVAALSRAHATAILCCGRVGDFDHGQLALEIAAELFPIRAVAGFGRGLADGIVPIDEVASDMPADDIDTFAEIAAVTFDVGADGPVPVERNAMHILSAGLLIGRDAGAGRGSAILSTVPVSSYAGLSASLVPWLMSGGRLEFHHPFAPDILARQIEGCDILVVPDVVALRLAETSLLGARNLRAVISICRSPERFAAAAAWPLTELALVDVAGFGELALLTALRRADGHPAPWPLRFRSADGDSEIAQIYVTSAGTLGIRGALAAGPDTDTGYACTMAPDQNAIIVTAAPSGVANVGGYRLALRDLQHAIRMIDDGSLIAALPHSLTGHRLAGHASDPAAMRQTLQDFGLGPLVTGAFRDRAT
jgi:hypothetical protein